MTDFLTKSDQKGRALFFLFLRMQTNKMVYLDKKSGELMPFYKIKRRRC